MNRNRRCGFTLIELLVVVAIISLLISILLPSLKCARESARSAKCGVQLRSLGTGMATYFTENKDWIPGINTTGFGLWAALQNAGSNPLGVLRNQAYPVQNFDWISPLLRNETDLGANRAVRFQTIVNRYQCPSNAGVGIDTLYFGTGFLPQERPDFDQLLEGWSPLSYLMPAHFQWWGQSETGNVGTAGPNNAAYPIRKANPNWEVRVNKYRSKLDQVGPSARKICATDGTRFLDGPPAFQLDHDVAAQPTFFGSFTSGGAWWGGDTAYGVRSGSANWDGQPVQVGNDPPSGGRNLRLTYRHGCSSGEEPVDCRSNKGKINALFFDGHISALDDRQSREITYWYPSGAVVQTVTEGMTTVPNGFEIP